MRAGPCTRDEAAQFLGAVLGEKANPAGELSMEMLLDGACFMARDEQGSAVGAYVLRGKGAQVWVQAAAGRADGDLAVMLDELIERHAKGFAEIAFRTHRRGLVRKALKRGYEVIDSRNGFVLRKRLQ